MNEPLAKRKLSLGMLHKTSKQDKQTLVGSITDIFSFIYQVTLHFQILNHFNLILESVSRLAHGFKFPKIRHFYKYFQPYRYISSNSFMRSFLYSLWPEERVYIVPFSFKLYFTNSCEVEVRPNRTRVETHVHKQLRFSGNIVVQLHNLNGLPKLKLNSRIILLQIDFQSEIHINTTWN